MAASMAVPTVATTVGWRAVEMAGMRAAETAAETAALTDFLTAARMDD